VERDAAVKAWNVRMESTPANDRGRALADADEMRAIIDWTWAALRGECVHEFAGSIPLVRLALDCRATGDEARVALAAAENECYLLKGAMAAQDGREQAAGERCGVSALEHGCDWPDAVADSVVDLRRQLAGAEAERDHWEGRAAKFRAVLVCANNNTRRVRAKYQDALTVLLALGVRNPKTDERGLCVRASEVLHCVGVLEMQAWERIRPDLERAQEPSEYPPLGHAFIGQPGSSAGLCAYADCGQPRAAHEPPRASVAGRQATLSLGEFERRCEIMLGREQEKPLPDTALIGILCEAVRLVREYGDSMRTLAHEPHRGSEP